MKLLIKFPTKNRVDKFFKTLDKYIDLLSNSNDYKFLITCDVDDHSMNNKEIIDKLSNYKNLEIKFGNNNGKISAINADMTNEDFDILLLASDDMIPEVKNYDELIRNLMIKYYPDTDGVLWFNDGFQGLALNTLVIMGKKYYDRFGYIYHPSYKSFYCDNEFTEVSKYLNKVIYIQDILIRHEHPCIEKYSDMYDDLYKHNDSYASIDRENWILRKNNNYDL